MANKMDHITPDLKPEYDAKSAEAAKKKVETLRKKEADLVEELRELRKEISVEIAASRSFNEPGFSNAPSAKEQTAANKAAQEENLKTSTATKK